ncbi:RNase H domain-containing protein [Nephila pilipes]|uniref:RNase H domain-containing protein n=1 Tax=Nephila pilipes TaxID=299642 RepID=A0A8X6NLA8_NEPPI|nr:RNase H domain-containing protein [Nephila pilipes]
MADLLAKDRSALPSAASNERFISEIFSTHRAKANSTSRVPPAPDWYDGNHPDISLQPEGTRSTQTALARWRRSHIKSLKFMDKEKTYSSCPCSRTVSSAPLNDYIGVSPRQLWGKR